MPRLKNTTSLLTAAALACLLAPFACPAATAAVHPAAVIKELCEDVKKPFYLPQGEAGCYEPARPGAFKTGNSFEMPKPAGKKRIFLIGESNAALLARLCPGGRRSCFSLLAASLGYDAQVLNAGMPTYNSDRTYGVMKEVMAYSPDAVVALAGNSENSELCPGLGRRLEEGLYRVMNRLVWRLNPFGLAKKYSLARQARVFNRMGRLAREKKIPLVLCVLPSNLSDFPPMGPLPLDDKQFSLGWSAYLKGRFVPAVDAFTAYLAGHPEDAMGRYYLGRAQLGAGSFDAARESLTLAADRDIHDTRCAGSRGGVIRAAALKSGALLADLEALFAGYAPHGIPGRAIFDDKTHWTPDYDMLVSCALMDTLAQAPGLAPPAGGKVWDSPLCRAAAARARRPAPDPAREKKIVANYLSAYLSLSGAVSRGGTRLYEAPVAIMQRLYRLEPAYLLKISSSPAAFAAAAAAAAGAAALGDFQAGKAPGFWPYYLAHLGETLSRSGEPGLAVKYFTQALLGGMATDEIYFYRAAAYFRAGDRKSAVADLARLPPGQTRAANLAGLYGAEKELAGALEAAAKQNAAARPAGPDEPGSQGGDATLYYVYGGQAQLTGGDGFHPEKFGYTLLGSAPTGVTAEFRGKYPHYAIVVRYTAVLEVDALQLSNGSYYAGGFSDGNVLGWENASGAPDGRYARIGGNGGLREGYLLISPGLGSSGVRVYARPDAR